MSTWWVLFAGEVPEDGDLVTSRRVAAAATASVAPHVRGTGLREEEGERKSMRENKRPARNEQSVRQRLSSRTLGLGPWALSQGGGAGEVRWHDKSLCRLAQLVQRREGMISKGMSPIYDRPIFFS